MCSSVSFWDELQNRARCSEQWRTATHKDQRVQLLAGHADVGERGERLGADTGEDGDQELRESVWACPRAGWCLLTRTSLGRAPSDEDGMAAMELAMGDGGAGARADGWG